MDLPQRAQRAAKDTKGILTDWLIRGCGALPHAPAGRSSPCTPGTSATCHQDDHRRCRRFRRFRSAPAGEGRRGRPGEQRTENRERRTENGAPLWATKKSLSKETKLPSLQTSKLPITPAPPARLRRAIKTTTGDAGDAGDSGAPRWGGALCAPENGEQRTENREQRTENREQRTERPCGRQRNR